MTAGPIPFLFKELKCYKYLFFTMIKICQEKTPAVNAGVIKQVGVEREFSGTRFHGHGQKGDSSNPLILGLVSRNLLETQG